MRQLLSDGYLEVTGILPPAAEALLPPGSGAAGSRRPRACWAPGSMGSALALALLFLLLEAYVAVGLPVLGGAVSIDALLLGG